MSVSKVFKLFFLKYLFSKFIYSSFYTVYNETYKSFHGIETYGYILDEKLWENATLNPSNQGFCSPNCLVSGVFNLSKCVTSNLK